MVTKKKSPAHHVDLQTVATACGAVAIIMLVAVYLSSLAQPTFFNVFSMATPATQSASALLAAGMKDFSGQPMPSTCYDLYTSQPATGAGGEIGNAGMSQYGYCNVVPGAYLAPARASIGGNTDNRTYDKAPLAILSAHIPGVLLGGVSAVQRISQTVQRNFSGGGGGGIKNGVFKNSYTLTTSYPSNSPITFFANPGSAVQLEWACQEKQTVGWTTCNAFLPFSGSCLSENGDNRKTISFTSPASMSLMGPGTNVTGQLSGSANIVAPTTGGATNTYTLTCPSSVSYSTDPIDESSKTCNAGEVLVAGPTYSGGGRIGGSSATVSCCPAGSTYDGTSCNVTQSVPVSAYPVIKVTAANIAQPTATIQSLVAGAQSNTVEIGQTTKITANFTADTVNGDALAATAINGGPGKTEDESVAKYSLPKNCGSNCGTLPDAKKVTDFTPTQLGDQTFYANSITNAYGWDHRAHVTVNVVCPAAISSQQGSLCVCNDPTLTFNNNGTCTLSAVPPPPGPGPGPGPISPVGSIDQALIATPARVRAGTQASLSWSTSNMTSCSVKDSKGAFVSSDTSSTGTLVPISGVTTFTLSCTDGTATKTSVVTVNLVPTFQEI